MVKGERTNNTTTQNKIKEYRASRPSRCRTTRHRSRFHLRHRIRSIRNRGGILHRENDTIPVFQNGRDGTKDPRE